MNFEPKLVRDEIATIISNNGENPVVSRVKGEEYLKALFEKLTEECDELRSDRNIEEAADVLEVLISLFTALGYDWRDVEAVRIEKRKERGGFEKGLILESMQ